jgi:hypothetical protein
VSKQVHTVGRRGCAKLVDLFPERGDLIARFVEGLQELLVPNQDSLDQPQIGLPTLPNRGKSNLRRGA